MSSIITLTFNSQPANGTAIAIADSYTGKTYTITFNNPAVFPIPTATANIGIDVIATAVNYKTAFNNKYNASLLYTFLIGLVPATCEITGINANTQWSVISNTTAGAVTTGVVNGTPPAPSILVTATTVTEAASLPCTTFDLDITTDILGDNLLSPVSEPISGNPHSLTGLTRQNQIQVTVEKIGSPLLAKKQISVPLLLTSYFDVDIVNTPAGATVSVVRKTPWIIGETLWELLPTLEFSLDNVSWQTSNAWSGIPDGAGTMYIRDNIGCQISIAYTVDAFSPNLVDFDSVLDVSRLNPIQFKTQEVWANCGVRKNVDNVLSYEEVVDLNRRDFTQKFQTCDVIRTQIRGNWETITAKLIDCDGAEANLPVVATTANMNITDVRDGTTFDHPDTGQLGVLFGAGKTYDPITTLDTGVDYNLGQSIMSWINVGDYINIEGAGWCLISEIVPPVGITDFTKIYTTTQHDGLFGLAEVVKITSVYNIVDYDRYEFEVDMALLLGDYYVEINGVDSIFGSKTFISEWLNVKVEQNYKHHLVNYYNSINNEINYATGITFSIRMPYVKNLTWSVIDEQEVYFTDTKTILLETRMRDKYIISLMPVPMAMAQKYVAALSHDRLQVDGINFVREGEPEVTPFGTTNLYLVKASLIRSDYTFSNGGGTNVSEVLLGSGTPLAIDPTSGGLLWVE